MPEFTGRITIDGKGVFDYVLTPATDMTDGDTATTPSPNVAPPPNVAVNIPPAAQRQVSVSDGDVFTVQLIRHEMKTGKTKAGADWEKHSFRGSDNRWYSTFKSEITAQLSPLVGQGTPVKLVAKANNFKGHDIVRVLGA